MAEEISDSELEVSLEENMLFGENGSKCFATSGDKNIDIFFSLLRSTNEAKLKSDIDEVYETTNEDDFKILFVLCFQTRDCRGGKGEKTISYKFFLHLFSKYPETACKLVHLFKEFGYFKDFITILEMIYEKPDF